MNKITASLFSLTLLVLTLPKTSTAALPTNVTVLTRDDFNGRNYFSVADALVGETSLNLERNGGHGTRSIGKIRGVSDSNKIIVLLDGHPLTHNFDGRVDLTQIPLNIVERIEITRGAASLSYTAEAIGGVIHIVTSRPNRKGLKARIGSGVGRDGTKKFEGRFLGRSHIGDLSFLTGQEESNGYSINEDTKSNNYFGNVSRSFNGKGFFGFEYFYNDAREGISNGTPIPFSQWNAHLERLASDVFRQQTQTLQHAKGILVSPRFWGGTLHGSYAQTSRDSDIRATPGGTSLESKDTITRTAQVSWKGKTFELGGQKREFKRDFFPRETVTAHQNSVFLTKKLNLGSWIIAPAVRHDHHSAFDGVTNPKLTIIKTFSESVLVSANAAGGIRVPNFDELFVSSTVINNPTLDPERSVTTDLGIALGPLKVTGFYTRIQDLITTNPTTLTQQNKGTEKISGAETDLTLRFWNFVLNGNWTFQRGRRDTPTSTGFVPSALTPRHLVFLRLNWNLPKAQVISNEIRYESEQFQFDNRLGLRIPSFYVWNLRYRIRILAADLYASIENVTRRRYAETIGSNVLWPQPERTFWTGVSVKFLD